MLLLAAAVALADPPREGKLDARPQSRFAVGDEREQVVTVGRRSTYQTAGVSIAQAVRYALASRLAVSEVKPDGGATVRQTVTAAELLAADDGLRGGLADALKATAGTSFELTVGPTGEATAVTGLADPLRKKKDDGKDGVTVRVGAVLDADAWRELAGLTLFAPDPAAKPGKPWDRPTAHDWGPLGGWAGRTQFAPRGRAGDAERYDFVHALSYRPPPAGVDGGLPVKLIEPRFAVAAAGGSVRYDRKLGRVTAADELFRVRGTATVVLAGQAVRLELEEEQTFELRVKPPGDAVLRGGPTLKR